MWRWEKQGDCINRHLILRIISDKIQNTGWTSFPWPVHDNSSFKFVLVLVDYKSNSSRGPNHTWSVMFTIANILIVCRLLQRRGYLLCLYGMKDRVTTKFLLAKWKKCWPGRLRSLLPSFSNDAKSADSEAWDQPVKENSPDELVQPWCTQMGLFVAWHGRWVSLTVRTFPDWLWLRGNTLNMKHGGKYIDISLKMYNVKPDTPMYTAVGLTNIIIKLYRWLKIKSLPKIKFD